MNDSMHSFGLVQDINSYSCLLFTIYHTRAIITRSWFETALNHKPRILDSKNEELPLFSTQAVCNSNLSII